MIFIIATMKTTPANREALIEATRLCIDETRKEPGCVSYDFYQSISDRQAFVFVERWINKNELERHFASPHLAVWREASKSLIVEKNVEIITPEEIELL
ncbi:MAG: antibiotic biosynthesis monooxygenase [Roseibium sp.]|uniref:putative quinol monooxygenase n=1 Tax=Roseibium sp. TaxID=1936156 RepID=UPI00260B0617|nr:putative quinol monooxygenase [Roseibium sp.]MCV0427343.1 antibiotic biosynthesis monooxygenase [Roseibium sp.]